MRHLYALALCFAVGCATPCPAQDAELLPGRCRCGPAERHNFGMDWDGQRIDRLNALLPRLERFVDGWIELPHRVERAFWWGGAYTASTTILLGESVVVLLWLATRKK